MKHKLALVSAYACSSDQGSEQSAGFEILAEVSQKFESVIVITRRKNGETLIRSLGKRQISNVLVITLDSSVAMRLKHKLPFGTYLYYCLWQFRARKLVSSLAEVIEIDFGIHATLAMDWMPTAFTRQTAFPWIWGPVGGAQRIPMTKLRTLGRFLPAEIIRLFIGSVGRRVFGRVNASNAAFTLAQNRETLEAFRDARNVAIIPNTIINVAEMPQPTESQQDRPLLVAGRLHRSKHVDFAIRVLSELGESQQLLIVGGGNDSKRCKRLSRRLGVQDRIEFRPTISRNELLSLMRNSRALLFPSLREGSSWVLAEALSVGLPVLAWDLPGSESVVSHCRTCELLPLSSGPSEWAKSLSQLPENCEPVTFDAQAIGNVISRL